MTRSRGRGHPLRNSSSFPLFLRQHMATAQKKRRAKARGVGEGCGAEGAQPLRPLGAAGPPPRPLPPPFRDPPDSPVAAGRAELSPGGGGGGAAAACPAAGAVAAARPPPAS